MKKAQSRVQMKCPECGTVFLPSLEEKQSRAGSSSRRKGANFERVIAKKLKKWWPGDYDFKRTPQSGGSVLKIGWGLAGDIATTDPNFPFHIECKNSPGSFKGLHNWFSNTSKVWQWLDQAISDTPEGKTPLLIFNRFDLPTYCASYITYDFDLEEILNKALVKHMRFCGDNGMTIYIWQLSDMLNSNPDFWK